MTGSFALEAADAGFGPGSSHPLAPAQDAGAAAPAVASGAASVAGVPAAAVQVAGGPPPLLDSGPFQFQVPNIEAHGGAIGPPGRPLTPLMQAGHPSSPVCHIAVHML
ncbi:unnamed protein product [Prorocentrum cordatum]|nr:unnamed protein product [Polarella glacialis]